MPQPLGGSGVGLQLPQYLYPSELYQAPNDLSQNYVTLAPGDALAVPAGNWIVQLGGHAVLQYLDPVNQIWRFGNNGARGGIQDVKSDGVNVRIANLTGCPVAAVVTNAGSGYAQSTTTCVPSAGNSTWQPIVGGMASVSSILNAGAGYGITPLVFIPAPPAPGVQATAVATLTSGTVSAVTMVNVGAGYTSAPTATVLPSPFDPNYGTTAITQASLAVVTYGAGSVAAVLCTNPGTSLSSVPTLTIAGGGASATATAVSMFSLTGISVVAAGAAYTNGAVLVGVGGVPTAVSANPNPNIEGKMFIPRPASALLGTPAGGSIASISTIYDGGLFLGTPGLVISALAGGTGATAASVTGVYGGVASTALLQPGP